MRQNSISNDENSFICAFLFRAHVDYRVSDQFRSGAQFSQSVEDSIRQKNAFKTCTGGRRGLKSQCHKVSNAVKPFRRRFHITALPASSTTHVTSFEGACDQERWVATPLCCSGACAKRRTLRNKAFGTNASTTIRNARQLLLLQARDCSLTSDIGFLIVYSLLLALADFTARKYDGKRTIEIGERIRSSGRQQ